MATAEAGDARMRGRTGCLAALVGLVVLFFVEVGLDSLFSSLPDSPWTKIVLGAVGLALAGSLVFTLVRPTRRRAKEDLSERGWQRKGAIPIRQAPIVGADDFVSFDEAKVALRCGRTTLNVLTLDGLDPCWSESGELGFTKASIDAEAAYRQTQSPTRLFLRTLGRALAKGV